MLVVERFGPTMMARSSRSRGRCGRLADECIDRRTVICMLVIAGLAAVWNIGGRSW